MWILRSTKDPGNIFYLLVGESYTVGRKDCKILILNDNSVSRKHATLTVTHSEANVRNPDARPVLTLSDSSKFGSVRNGNKIGGGSSVTLGDGDSVSFGAANSNQWRVAYTPLVVAFSSLPSTEKKVLKSLTLKLGGHVVPEWRKECTHLIMTQLTVTIKVIGALVTCRPVVTPAFLLKMEEAALSNLQMPDPIDFQPVVAEAAISGDDVSFLPNADRRTLFAGKNIVFLAQKQFKQLGQTVRLAGGKSQLLDEGLSDRDMDLVIDANTIVMYADPSDHSQVMTQAAQDWVKGVMDTLKRHGLRPVPQSELGLAVLYASTNIHCNPKVAQAGLTLLHPVAAPSLPTQDVLASQTQPTELHGSQATRSKPHAASRPLKEIAEKMQDAGPVRSEQTPTKKRMRDGDSSRFASPSKVPRREPGKGLGGPLQDVSPGTLQTPSRTKDGAIPKASPELPYVGVPASRSTEGPVGAVDTASSKEQRTSSRVVPAKQPDPVMDMHQDSVAAHQPKTLPEGGTVDRNGTTCPESSVGEDILSPTERTPEDRSRSASKKNEARPHRPRPELPPADSTKPVAPGTCPDDDNVIPPSGSEMRGRKTGRRRVDDLFAMETKEDIGEENAAEQDMWKKKPKRSRLMKESDEVNDGIDVESSRRIPLLDVPAGYLTANKTIKSEPVSPQDPTLPCNLAVVEQVVIAVKRPVMNGTRTAGGKKAQCNYKRFKKASYAGQHSMPRIIGGSDLEHREIGHIKEAEDMMKHERETFRKRHKEKDMADGLFDWEPRPTKRRR